MGTAGGCACTTATVSVLCAHRVGAGPQLVRSRCEAAARVSSPGPLPLTGAQGSAQAVSAENVSLADILLRDSGLNEQEAWAVPGVQPGNAWRRPLGHLPDPVHHARHAGLQHPAGTCTSWSNSAVRPAQREPRGAREDAARPGRPWSGAEVPRQPAWAWVGRPGAGPHWWVVLAGPRVHVAPSGKGLAGLSHLTCVGVTM